MIQAPGCETLITHVFRDGDPYLESDAVFGVRSTLVADWVRHPAGLAPDGSRLDAPYYTLDYDFVLNPKGRRHDPARRDVESGGPQRRRARRGAPARAGGLRGAAWPHSA